MKTSIREQLVCAAVLFAIAALPAAAGEEGQSPEHYVRRDTWQETLRVSREALMRAEAEKRRAMEAARKSNPAMREFQPLRRTLKGDHEPVPVRISVKGLDRLYLYVTGPDDGGFLEPRLTDGAGKTAFVDWDSRQKLTEELHLGGGHINWHPDNWRRPVRHEGRELRSALEVRDTELCIRLEGRYEWFETTLDTRWTNNYREVTFGVDCQSRLRPRREGRAKRLAIWQQVCRDFPGDSLREQQRLEMQDAIWLKLGRDRRGRPEVLDARDWQPGDFAELARRYAEACGDELKPRAEKLAAEASGPADLAGVRSLYYLDRTQRRRQLAEQTLAFVERHGPRPELRRALEQASTRIADGANGPALYEEIRRLRRRIIFSHPDLDFDRLLVNKRPPPLYSHMCDQYLGRHSLPGPGLTVLENWKDELRERPLIPDRLPEGSVLHPSLSYNGQRVVFSFCDHTEERRDRRRFFIYEAATDGSWVRQLTGTASDPLEGAGGRYTVIIEDFDPCYLPDGSIVFTSTRSQNYGRCHGGRYTPSYLLYKMNADGSGIRQLSFGEANEWSPDVLHDGRIVYTRWDYINRHDTIFQSLWTMRPDGTGTAHLYGNYTRNPCMTSEAMAVPGSRQVVSTACAHHSYTSGSIIVVDPHRGLDGEEPITRVTPEANFPETEGWPDCAYATPWPLNEEMYLCAYTPDRLIRQGGVQRENAYGIYLVDTLGGREPIYRDPDVSSFSPMPIRPRRRPRTLPTVLPDEAPETGQLYVQDVHRCTQPLEPGSVKALRVNRIHVQSVAWKPWLSDAQNEILKEVEGTVPVEPDGSVALEVPAEVPLQLQALDGHGMAVMTMRSCIYVQPGETLSCVGCHEPRESGPPPRANGQDLAFRKPAPPAGPEHDGPLSFPRTVQPVLDRHCIRCHGLQEKKGGVCLLGTPGDGSRHGRPSVAYSTLVGRKGLVVLAHRNRESYYSKPKEYYAHAGKLAGMLLEGHQGVELPPADFERIVNWLDLNAQYYGTYLKARVEDRKPDPDGEKALRAHIKQVFGPEIAEQPFHALVNVAEPSESRILKAPLAEKAGGWGQMKPRWSDATAPGYRRMRELVERAIQPLPEQDNQLKQYKTVREEYRERVSAVAAEGGG